MTESADRQTGIAAIAQRPDEFECFYSEHLDTVRIYLARRVDDPQPPPSTPNGGQGQGSGGQPAPTATSR